jgi:hypothetical protein
VAYVVHRTLIELCDAHNESLCKALPWRRAQPAAASAEPSRKNKIRFLLGKTSTKHHRLPTTYILSFIKIRILFSSFLLRDRENIRSLLLPFETDPIFANRHFFVLTATPWRRWPTVDRMVLEATLMATLMGKQLLFWHTQRSSTLPWPQ